MKEYGVELSVTEIKGIKIIKLSGKVDWENARALDKEIQKLIENGATRIAFNLSDVSFICSGGIGALVYNLNKVQKMNGAMYLISSNEYVNYLFSTLKFDVVFEGYLYNSYESFSEQVLDKIN